MRPRLIVIEYNASFGPDRSVTIPYTRGFDRYRIHASGFYYGASLTALARLGERKGYVSQAATPEESTPFWWTRRPPRQRVSSRSRHTTRSPALRTSSPLGRRAVRADRPFPSSRSERCHPLARASTRRFASPADDCYGLRPLMRTRLKTVIRALGRSNAGRTILLTATVGDPRDARFPTPAGCLSRSVGSRILRSSSRAASSIMGSSRRSSTRQRGFTAWPAT